MADSLSVITRFAPSPSGHLHVGGARTALFNWAYARRFGGTFILRIEDTDQKRSSDASSMAFLDDLAWLGIDWDEGPEYETSKRQNVKTSKSSSVDAEARSFGGGENGPYFQAQRLEIYERYMEQLVESGKAYRAFETPEELDAKRDEARRLGKPYRYDRAALQLDEATVKRYLDEGRPYVVRFKVPENETITVHDEVLGDVVKESSEYDDFVIRKADGYPTYHFAVVVDDELMGVTHVIRAQEHLNNTHRHQMLQDALGFRRPKYAHISVITNPNGSKMSKRDKDKALRAAVRATGLNEPPTHGDRLAVREDEWAWWMEDPDRQLDADAANALAEVLGIHLPEINVDDFRRSGYLPDVMVNYLALLGWNPGGDREKFDRDFLIQHFDFDRVIKSSAKFDREKLLAFNLDAIQQMDADEFASHLRLHAEQHHPEFIERLGEDRFELFARANQSRSKTLDDPFRSDRFFIIADEHVTYEESKPVRKALAGGEPNGYAHLEALLPRLRELSEWTIDEIEAEVKQYADDYAEGKLGKVAQPLRIAVTGGTISPAIFDTLAILGRDSTIRRIERCLALKGTLAS
jgi:glutamyl/glutaminyl-tRNA synthetase